MATTATSTQLPPVLFVGDHFGYPNGVSHGVTTYFLEVLPALVAAGVRLTTCFLREPHPAAAGLAGTGVEPIFFGAKPSDPSVVLRVADVARRRGCGIVHAAGIKATLAARVAARGAGARTLLHIHDRNMPGPVVRRLQHAFARPGDLGLCVADAVRDVAVAGYHVRPERVRVVPNSVALERLRGVAPDAAARVRGALGIDPHVPLLGVVGRLYAVKGQQALLQMLPPIVARFPTATLLLIGDGPDRTLLEDRARALGLAERVRFLGQRADVPELLSALDLVLVPSESEGLPIAAIEALAAGRPIVAFDVGGMREVVTDGVDGDVVPAGDREAFVHATLALLAEPARRAVYGAHAARAAERFGLGTHVRALIDCYREAIS